MKKYTYTCDCKSKRSAPVMKQTEVNDNKQCIKCGHFAFLTEIRNGRVWTHEMKESMRNQKPTSSFDERFLYMGEK